MNPDHDRQLAAAMVGHPYVDVETILWGNRAPRRSRAPSGHLHAIMTEIRS
jgi:hypothetical protein